VKLILFEPKSIDSSPPPNATASETKEWPVRRASSQAEADIADSFVPLQIFVAAKEAIFAASGAAMPLDVSV